MTENLLEIKNLKVEYTTSKLNGSKTVKAVNGLSFVLQEGETYAIAGESGCGKSTLAKAVIGLISPKSGEILFCGKNIADFNKKELREYRKNVQMVFQNPYSSLNPKMTIRQILSEPLEINTSMNADERLGRIEEIINKVELSL